MNAKIALVGGMGILLPLAIAPKSLSFNFDATPKALAVLAISAALLLMPGVCQRSYSCLRNSQSGKWFLWFVLAETVSLVVSTAMSADPQLSLFGTHWRYFGAFTQLALLVLAVIAAGIFVAQPESVRFALRACSLAGLLAAVYGVLQFFGVDPLMDISVYKLNLPGQVVRPPSSLGHAGYFAGFETVVFFTALAVALREAHPRWRDLHFIAAVMAVIGVLVSGTRAGVVAMGAGLVMIFLLQGTRVIKGRTLMGLLALAVVAISAILLTPSGRDLRERVHQWTEDPGGTRLPLWRDTLSLVAARPLVGSGSEMFVTSFPLYQSQALTLAYPDFQHESPHNMFLDVAVSQGLLGLAALMFGVGLAGWCAWKAPAANRPMAQVLAAGLFACVVFHQFFVFTLPNACVFLLLMAALVSLAPGSGVSEAPARRFGTMFRVSSTMLGLIFLAAFVQVLLTDFGFARIDAALRRGDLAGAAAAHRSALRTRWLGYTPELWYSQQMNAAARVLPTSPLQDLALAEAGQSSRRAVQSPGEDLLVAEYNRAATCALSGELDEANRMALELSAHAPNWYQPHWALSRLLFQQGKFPEARREGQLALALSINSKPALHAQIGAFMRALAAR